MRHRPPHFGHVFSGGGYAAAYYSYMWSEVLDADAFAAFEETGDIFDPATAKRLRDTIYAAGGSRDPADAYKAFRGRLPSADALLRKRGFAEPRGDRRRSMTDLHSAGHRRGVVCAPHSAAVEAGRAILAEGGNAIEAMVAMAATHRRRLSAHEPYRRRRLLADPRADPAACAPSWRPGPPARRRTPELYRELRDHPAARAACGAHRAGRGRRLDAGARGRARRTAASCRSTCCWRRRSAMPATAMP